MPDAGLLREAQDPTTPAARLAEIAATAPELGAEIAAHPNTYPELLDWIEQYGDERGRTAVAARRTPGAVPPAVATPAAPASPFGDAPAAAPAAAPASPFGDTPAASAPAASATRKRAKTPLIIAASVVGALVLGGGIAGAIVLPRVLPAGSPDGAVEKLLGAATGLDPLSLAGSLAPSEISALTGSLERLRDVQVDGDDDVNVQKALERLSNALEVTTEDLEFATVTIAEGVERVQIVDGVLEVDGDEDEVIEAYLELLRVQYELGDMSTNDIERSLEYQRSSLESSLRLPWELDFREVEDGLGFPLSVVTVQEGAGWYVSPLLSYADFLYLTAGRYSELPRLGKKIPAAAPASSAAAAAENTLVAALDTRSRDYWEELAATLPTAERRLVAIYGPAFGDNPWFWAPDTLELRVESTRFENAGDGRTIPGDVTVGWEDGERRTGGEISVDEYCADWEITSSWYDYYWDDWETSTNRGGGCLAELPIDLKELGLDAPQLLAVNEGGGWLFSPLATLGDWSATATENLVRLSKDGELDRLVKQR